jgi:hypothetical protein
MCPASQPEGACVTDKIEGKSDKEDERGGKKKGQRKERPSAARSSGTRTKSGKQEKRKSGS